MGCALIDGVIFDKTQKRLICYPVRFDAERYAIPEGVVSIGDYAFAYAGLKTVEISDSVTVIGDRAFSYCDVLSSVAIPGSLTYIGTDAFLSCPNLTLTVERDSHAAEYCKENKFNYTYPDSNDWLNS